MRFSETKVVKAKIYGAKKSRNIWDVNVYNIIILKLVEIKTNSWYLIRYLNKGVVRPLVLVLPKMSGYVQT